MGEVIISNVLNSYFNFKGVLYGYLCISWFLGLLIKVKDKVVGMVGLVNKFDIYIDEDVEFL